MVSRAITTALAASSLFASAIASGTGPKGTRQQKCPKDSPCTSLYGDCGIGAFCLGGCDPTMSNTMKSCVPNPQCKSFQHKFDSKDGIESIDKYLGDATKADWQAQGDVLINDGQLMLTMAEGTSGTLLASTHYVWYGKICAKMATSQGKGVVTAFIMMSDVKDEIDFEWVGVDIQNAQSNFYSQGVTTYTNGKNLTVPNGNTVEKLHDYCIDWKPDTLSWSIDGKEARKLERKDTWNATANRFDYPQTPSRVMLSLWPAGLATNEKGTRDWAGGEIDWNSPYMVNGYYYARVAEVSVDCYDPPSGARKNGDKSYVYTDDKNPTNNTIEMSDKFVVLGSLYASGDDPDFGKETKSDSPKPTKSAATVPGGIQGGGNRGGDEVQSGAPQGTNAPGSGNPGGESGGSNDFSQGGGNGGSAASSIQPGLGKVGGSAFAIVLALFGLMIL